MTLKPLGWVTFSIDYIILICNSKYDYFIRPLIIDSFYVKYCSALLDNWPQNRDTLLSKRNIFLDPFLCNFVRPKTSEEDLFQKCQKSTMSTTRLIKYISLICALLSSHIMGDPVFTSAWRNSNKKCEIWPSTFQACEYWCQK